MEDLGKARSVSRPAGAIIVDGQQVADTLQCVHCQAHWVPVRGSGRVRGWCSNCQGPVCGPRCAACTPFERRMDEAERAARLRNLSAT